MTAAVVTSVDDALALLRAGVEAMQAVDLHGLAESALVEAARELEAVSRQVSSAVTSMDGHLSQRMVAGSLGYLNDTSLLRGLHRLTAGQAKARLRLGDLVGERRSVTGEVLPPELPATAAGFAAGSLSPAHVVVIADVLRALPEPVRREHRAAIDELLATHAATLDTRDLKALAQRLVATLHPDGPEPSDEIRDGKRAGWLRVAPDGSGELWARLTPSAVALWQTVLTPLLTSGHEPAVPDLMAGDDVLPPAAPVEFCPDRRTPKEKFHDALEEAARRVLMAGELPSTAGVPTTLMITIGLRDLEGRVGQATTHHGGTLTVAEALRLAADARVIPVVLDDAGGVLAYGRSRRLASIGQRRVLTARDRGCTFPGCTKGAAQSEVHHAPDFARDGQTDVHTMCLACRWHQTEAIRQGWRTVMLDGRPWWRPPEHIDPERTLRRNHLWDTPNPYQPDVSTSSSTSTK